MHDHQSQEQLAEATELSIAQLESGKNFPNLTTISIICKFYNITLGEFFAPLDYPTKDKITEKQINSKQEPAATTGN